MTDPFDAFMDTLSGSERSKVLAVLDGAPVKAPKPASTTEDKLYHPIVITPTPEFVPPPFHVTPWPVPYALRPATTSQTANKAPLGQRTTAPRGKGAQKSAPNRPNARPWHRTPLVNLAGRGLVALLKLTVCVVVLLLRVTCAMVRTSWLWWAARRGTRSESLAGNKVSADA